MAPRTFWKGYLKLSLVTCPVTMEPARTAGETLRFHTVNRETGNRVESQYVDAETGKPVAEDDQAKGYEIEDDRFVILEDEELEAVGLESTRTIDIERFVPREDVSWILARPAAPLEAGRQGRRGGLRGDPRGNGCDRDGGGVAAGAIPA